ncbi:DUF835 domain-containing protein [Pyrococcus abyssi]|uniref:DUF835 domain-containing protein n=1 Tax=Pyrococcus abyssi (strain GE5 / Orsay) TaxID=272844 RepID=Q9V2J1_PYRAB|nr:DUF835 domain-containing protein [Pyrococcus abyssi]CAB49007.1 Hypothetical protein PAB0044 [Pyrococcus abyssi GE5]CCE69458.1 TPA: hypothetical protein PAB0044 [Pyrococcus abyssi GE5]
MEVISPVYFIRDIIVLIVSLTAVIIIVVLRNKAKEAMKYWPFAMASISALVSFTLISIAQIIGALLNTSVLYDKYEPWQLIRSVLLIIAAILLLVSVLSFYIPFGRGKYVIFRIRTEEKFRELWGAYWCYRDQCYAAFKALLNARFPGIAITRDPPEVFRGKLNLHLTPVIWISKVKHEEAVSPTRLEFLTQRIADFLRSAEIDKVILIDCLDYLILENGENAVIKFVTRLKDLAMLHRGIILVTIDESVLSEKVVSFLKRELEPISNLNLTKVSPEIEV